MSAAGSSPGVSAQPRTPTSAAGTSNDDLKAVRDEMAAIAHGAVDTSMTNPAAWELSPFDQVEAAVDALVAAGFRRVAEDPAEIEIRALEKTLEASRGHARRARNEGLDEETCRFWSGVSGFLRSRIRALKAGEEPDWPDAVRVAAALAAPRIKVDDRPRCTAERPTDCHEGPHICGLEEGHPESEHRCPCDEDWTFRGGEQQ